MLKAAIKDPARPLLLAGLSDGNIMRLKAGQPIKCDLRSFGVDLPGALCIVHGTTEADIELMLRQHGLLSEGTTGSVDPRIDQEAAIRADHKRILIGMMGLPRSGKTTWARSQAYPIVCPDAIRLALHGQRYVEQAEPFVWATAKVMARALFLAGHRVVILDATNATRKRRDEWRSREWGTFWKVIGTGKDECLARAGAEGDEEIVPVIERMAGQWEPLGSDEPLWP